VKKNFWKNFIKNGWGVLWYIPQKGNILNYS